MQDSIILLETSEATEEKAPAQRSIDEIPVDKVMAAFRQACRGRGTMMRDDLLKAVSERLGYQRLGKVIAEALKGHLRAAIRRKIIGAEGQAVFAETTWMDEYTRDELVDTIRSVMRQGCNYDREDVIAAVAAHLGFARITATVRDPIKSAINAAIRRGLLDYDGPTVWRKE